MKFNKDKIFNIVVILIFVLVSVMLGLHHEAWADEAQSWLLARDASIYQLLTVYCHAEGHPILWYLVLKPFIYLGLPYSKIFIVSLIINTIGVILFLFKSKFNKIIKILFIFSYFILYQYNIIARSYCLIFLLLVLLAILWEDRHKHLLLFSIIIILMINTEVYLYLFAGSIFLIWILEWYKNKYDNKINHIITFIILFISFLLVILYVYPYSTNAFNAYNRTFNLSYCFFYPYLILTGFDKIKSIYILFGFITSLIILILHVIRLKKDKINAIRMLIIFGPMLCFYIFKYFSGWHLGIVFIEYVFYLWIYDLHDDKFFKKFLLFSLIMQLPWTLCSLYNDIKYQYSGSYEAYKFIDKYDVYDKKIYGVNFYSVALYDSSFYYWDGRGKFYDGLVNYCNAEFCEDNKDFSKYSSLEKMYIGSLIPNKDYFIDNDIDIIVASVEDLDISFYDFFPEVEEYYNKYYFYGKQSFEFNCFNMNYFIFVRKDIDIN